MSKQVWLLDGTQGLFKKQRRCRLRKQANPQLGESIEMIIDDDDKGSHDSGDTSFSEKTDRELFGCEA